MNKLILIWHNEGSKPNEIGEIVKEKDYYTFRYTNFELNDLQLFSEKGLFPGFFDINNFYKSNFLFQNIKDRLPQENRIDYSDLLKQYNIKNPEDEFEVLEKTEGKINSDNFKFVTQEKLFELQKD